MNDIQSWLVEHWFLLLLFMGTYIWSKLAWQKSSDCHKNLKQLEAGLLAGIMDYSNRASTVRQSNSTDVRKL